MDNFSKLNKLEKRMKLTITIVIIKILKEEKTKVKR